MRYPIYFFLLLTGFFYLTGKPIDDKVGETASSVVASKGQQLEYARRTSSNKVVDKSTSSGDRQAVKERGIAAGLTKTAVTTTPVKVAPKSIVVAEVSKSPAKAIKQVAAKMPAKAEERKWQPSAFQPVEKPSLLVSSPAPYEVKPKKRFRVAAKKPLDWTVFGNDRSRSTSKYVAKPNLPSKDEVDANRIPAKALVEERRKIRKKARKYRKARHKRRLAKARAKKRAAARAARKARKARLALRKKARRYARVKRRSKGAYRVARRAKKKSRRKRYASYKPRRKKFGFAMKDGSMQLFGGN